MRRQGRGKLTRQQSHAHEQSTGTAMAVLLAPLLLRPQRAAWML
jgi:hypothetical protein